MKKPMKPMPPMKKKAMPKPAAPKGQAQAIMQRMLGKEC